MFTRYKGVNVPNNYSGNRFRREEIKTEMKTHRPSPAYSSTRTSVSPTFHQAVKQAHNEKTSDGVSKTEEIVTDKIITNEDIKDAPNLQNNFVPTLSAPSFPCDECCDENKKGIGAILNEIKPLINKLTSKVKDEDLLLISLILLLAREESNEAMGALLPLALLFLYS